MKTIALCGLAVLLSAGCNPELDQYNQIDMGKPLASRGVLTSTTTAPEIDGKSYSCFQYFLWPLPSIMANKSMGVLADKAGNVVAKQYINCAREHFLITQLGFYDRRLEVQVPPEYFRETPATWRNEPSGYDAFRKLKDVFRGLSDGLHDDERRCGISRHDAATEYVDVLWIPVNPKRLRIGVLERITEKDSTPLIDFNKDLDLDGIDAAKVDELNAVFKLLREGQRIFLKAEIHTNREDRYLAGYIAKICGQFDFKPSPQCQRDLELFQTLPIISAFNFIQIMVISGNMRWPDSFENHPDDLKGLTQDGFERVIDFGHGGIGILQNLGGRRIRIEYRFCHFYDPFFLLIYSGGPIRTEKTTVNRVGD
ncbi:MAG: hypothetical protein HZA50_09015 [Planctomycetes bacterium]|nr:hypothetical protein [Planctomycetota bacterium]